jgi:predicted deacylase
MRHRKMLPGAPRPVEHPLWIARYLGVSSEHDGIFYPLALPEAYVQKGLPIGYVTDYFGAKIADVLSPVNGVILYIGAVPSLKKGDNIANIGEIM